VAAHGIGAIGYAEEIMKRACLLLVFALTASAQAKFEFWPGAAYDPAVTTPRKVLGYDFGDHISSHANMVR